MRLFVHEAEARGLTTEALNGLTWILERTIAKGFGDVDYSALFEAVNPPAASTPPSERLLRTAASGCLPCETEPNDWYADVPLRLRDGGHTACD